MPKCVQTSKMFTRIRAFSNTIRQPSARQQEWIKTSVCDIASCTWYCFHGCTFSELQCEIDGSCRWSLNISWSGVPFTLRERPVDDVDVVLYHWKLGFWPLFCFQICWNFYINGHAYIYTNRGVELEYGYAECPQNIHTTVVVTTIECIKHKQNVLWNIKLRWLSKAIIGDNYMLYKLIWAVISKQYYIAYGRWQLIIFMNIIKPTLIEILANKL